MRVCLIRHFTPDVPAGICYGQSDMGFAEPSTVRDQYIEALRAQLSQALPENTVVFSSPLRRCAEIAAALSTEVIHDHRLRELDFGEWEMQSWEAIGSQALDAWANDLAGFRPPGGETGHELQRRVLHWLQDTACVHDTAVVVTHGGVMRALQAHHQQLPGAQWLDLRYDFGQMLILDFTPEQIHAPPVQ